MLKIWRKVCRGDAAGRGIIPVLLLAVTLTACKTWYKQGGDADELDVEQRNCVELTGRNTGETFAACMAEAGWHTTTMSVTVTEPGDADVETTFSTPESAAGEHDPAVVETRTSGAVSQQVDGLPDQPLNSGNSETEEQKRAAGSWFQLGTDAGDLEQDQTECKADADVSGSFDRCMRDKGWQSINIHMTTDQ